MTIEQCKKSILDKQSQITQLQSEVANRKRQLLEMSPIKAGDKVKVTITVWGSTIETIKEGYVKDVELDYNYSYRYNVREPNKAGNGPGIKAIKSYHNSRIEKIV